MINLFISLVLCCNILEPGNNQFSRDNMVEHLPANQAEISAVIHTLFDGMRRGDSTMVRSAFSSKAQLFSIEIRDQIPVLHEGRVQDFVNAVGTPHDKIWDERIGEPVIQADGPMAIAWVPYAFYLGDQFSHCGVNTFTFLKEEDAWKIINITDTRRKVNCPEL